MISGDVERRKFIAGEVSGGTGAAWCTIWLIGRRGIGRIRCGGLGLELGRGETFFKPTEHFGSFRESIDYMIRGKLGIIDGDRMAYFDPGFRPRRCFSNIHLRSTIRSSGDPLDG